MSRFSADELMRAAACFRRVPLSAAIDMEGRKQMEILVGKERAKEIFNGVRIGLMLAQLERDAETEVDRAIEEAGYGRR